MALALQPADARERRARRPAPTAPEPASVAAPLPPARPAEFKAPPAPAAPVPPTPAPQAAEPAKPEGPAGPPACYGLFAERGGVALPVPPAETSRPECAIEEPVNFREVDLPEGKVTLDSAVTLRCAFAVEVLGWIRDDLTALAQKENTKLTKLVGVGGQACRNRNAAAGAPISEHASGNALDLFGLTFENGRSVALAGKEPELRPLREAIQRSVCGRFTTVLGPGADASHKDHLHFDLRQRTRGFRMCQWAVE
ncbi:extensin-like domain-containing protein [Bosea thiooxidans]